MKDKKVNNGPYLIWMGGPDLDSWREAETESSVDFGDHTKEELDELSMSAFMERFSVSLQFATNCEWEYLIESLTEVINEGFSGYGHDTVASFGWLSVDGEQEFFAEEGADFLHHLLPHTDNHFKIFLVDSPGFAVDWADGIGRSLKMLKVQNYHHDSPMGNEWYTGMDVGETSICSECNKWFPEGDYYEHTWKDGHAGCVEHDEDLCQACGEKLYEEDD